MLPHRARRKADIIVSTLMIVFGFIIIIAATQMPWTSRTTGTVVQWYLSPGLYPAALGGFIILFSCMVLKVAIREVGVSDIGIMFMSWLKGAPSNVALHRVVMMIVLMGLYVFVGIGRIDFRIASAIFLFSFIALFWFPEPGMRLGLRIPITLAISVLVPVSVAYVFEVYFLIPMP